MEEALEKIAAVHGAASSSCSKKSKDASTADQHPPQRPPGILPGVHHQYTSIPPSMNGTPSWILTKFTGNDRLLMGSCGVRFRPISRGVSSVDQDAGPRAMGSARATPPPHEVITNPTPPGPPPRVLKSAGCIRIIAVTSHWALSANSPTMHVLPPTLRPPQKTPPRQRQVISQHITKPHCLGRITTPGLPGLRTHITWCKRGFVDNHKSATNVQLDLMSNTKFSRSFMKTMLFLTQNHKLFPPWARWRKNKGQTKFHLIHDASGPEGQALNDFSSNTTFRYQSVNDAIKLIKPSYFLAKVDLSNVYRSVGIVPPTCPPSVTLVTGPLFVVPAAVGCKLLRSTFFNTRMRCILAYLGVNSHQFLPIVLEGVGPRWLTS